MTQDPYALRVGLLLCPKPQLAPCPPAPRRQLPEGPESTRLLFHSWRRVLGDMGTILHHEHVARHLLASGLLGSSLLQVLEALNPQSPRP